MSTLLRRPEYLFFFLALIFGVASAIFVPQMSVADEDTHLLRVWQLSEGEIVVPQEVSYPENIWIKSQGAAGGKREYTELFNDAPSAGEPEVQGFAGTAAGYSPLCYVPQVAGMLVAKLIGPSSGLAVLLPRLFSAVFYAIAVALIISYVLVGKWVFAVVGLIPEMIHMAGSLSADTMTNVVGLATMALVLNLFVQDRRASRGQIAALLGLAAAIGLVKFSNVLLLLPLVVLPAKMFNPLGTKLRAQVYKWTVGAAAGIISFGLYRAWNAAIASGAASAPLPNPITDGHPLRFLKILYNTYIGGYGEILLKGLVGQFSSFLWSLPMAFVFLELLLVLLALMMETREDEPFIGNIRWPLVVTELLAGLLSVLGITWVLYSQWAILRLGYDVNYADGVQGRYFTLYLAVLAAPFIWLRRFICVKAAKETFIGWAVLIVGGGMLLMSVLLPMLWQFGVLEQYTTEFK
jgi:uncharacterized membrane protein